MSSRGKWEQNKTSICYFQNNTANNRLNKVEMPSF